MGRVALILIFEIVLFAGLHAPTAWSASRDPYEILGVARSASGVEIRKTYQKLARRYHPDLNGGDQTADAKLREINEAYQKLGSPGTPSSMYQTEISRPQPQRPTPRGQTFHSTRSSNAPMDPEVFHEASIMARKSVRDGGLGFTNDSTVKSWAGDVAKKYSIGEFELWAGKYEALLQLAMTSVSQLGLGKDQAGAANWAQRASLTFKTYSELDAWTKRFRFALTHALREHLPEPALWAESAAYRYPTQAMLEKWIEGKDKHSKPARSCFSKFIKTKFGL